MRPRIGIAFVQGDQSSAEDLQTVLAACGGPPTIVIDDGSHVGEHQIATFQHMCPQLATNGWDVIEDLHTINYPDYGGGHPPSRSTGIAFVKKSGH